MKCVSCRPSKSYVNDNSNSAISWDFSFRCVGRNWTTARCRHLTRSPFFINRFFFIEHSHTSCLKIFHSVSVSEKFLTWSVTYKGGVFNGIFGANIWKCCVRYGKASLKTSLRLWSDKEKNLWVSEKVSFLLFRSTTNQFTNQFWVPSNKIPSASRNSSLKCWQFSDCKSHPLFESESEKWYFGRKKWSWQLKTWFRFRCVYCGEFCHNDYSITNDWQCFEFIFKLFLYFLQSQFIEFHFLLSSKSFTRRH